MSQYTQSALSHRLIELRSRLNFSQIQMADYLGVSVFTLRKWESGERNAGAALIRLLDVLNFLEVFAPALHDGFLAQVSPAESSHVRKSRSKRSTDSVMSENPDRKGQPIRSCQKIHFEGVNHHERQ